MNLRPLQWSFSLVLYDVNITFSVRDNWQAAQQWLADPTAPPGDGSKAAAEIIEAGLSAAELMDPKEAQELRKICNDAKAKLAKLEQLRKDGKGKGLK